jgi:hypothetical protein
MPSRSERVMLSVTCRGTYPARLIGEGVLIVCGLSCHWWKFATRELYGMKFMQSNIKLGRDLSNLKIDMFKEVD